MSKAFANPACRLIAALAFLASTSSWATLFVSPSSKGGYPVVNSTAYYASSTAAGDVSGFNGAFIEPDTSYPFGIVLLNADQETDSALGNSISFTLSSDKTAITLPTGAVTAAIMVTTTGGTGGGVKSVPIAGVDGVACSGDSTSGICRTLSLVIPTKTHYFAVPFVAGQTIKLHFYPKDICTDYAAQPLAASAYGCTATDVVPSTGSTINAPMQLTFTLVTLDASGNKTADAVQDTTTASLAFQTDPPTFACPSTASLNNSYFPSDKTIILNGSPFNVPVQPAGRAPLKSLIVVGNKESTGPAVLTSSFLTANTVKSRVEFGETELVGEFENSTPTQDIPYQIGFMVKDATGIITPATSSCTLSGVRTSSIQGFLGKSNCFIATAAFRSIDSSPVAMLRSFRDTVLFKSELGTDFVHWYYSWSPAAAEWLMRHPAFRYPVLRALIPVELAAWFTLSVRNLL